MPPGAPSPDESDPTQDLAAALHEVSNALTVVIGWADAARGATDPSAVRPALDIVLARAAHARDIARRAIGASAPLPPPSPVPVIAGDAVLGLSVEAKRANVTVDVDVDPAARGLQVSAGPSLLQVLTNLLLNAIAFSPPGATVRLSVRPAPSGDGARPSDGVAPMPAPLPVSRVLFRVDDEGPGIAPEMRARVFEGGVTSRRGGAGIGLRHSAALAESAGGALRLAHAARGTRFELTWPVAGDDPSMRDVRQVDPRVSVAPDSEERPIEGRLSIDGARILVVEDDDAVIELLELALEARGASVVSVKARADLPRVLSTGRFDAALLDMSPLLGDVAGAVAELRRTNPQARLIVMSGSVPPAFVGGAAMWVRKPFEVREIVDALGSPQGAQQSAPQGARQSVPKKESTGA